MIKFGKKEHLEQLQAGVLYCKYVREFAKIDGVDVRYDPNEGISNLQRLKDDVIQLRPADSPRQHWKNLRFTNATLTTYRKGNLFCVSRFIINPRNEISKFEINKMFDGFGTHYLLVLHQPLFFDRLESAGIKHNYKISGRMVEYADLGNKEGERSVFQKDNIHSWQVEYRLYFDTNLKEPLFFEMDDISDISMIGCLKENRILEYKMGEPIISN